MAPVPISTLTQETPHISQANAEPSGPETNKVVAVTKDNPSVESSVCASFDNTFNVLLKDNLDNKCGLGLELTEMREWIKSVMIYNVPQGKHLRGRLVEMSYKGLVPDASQEMINLARILGWCLEILQAAFLVADDIMDGGHLRRGQPCWHRVGNKGNSAINDVFLLEHVVYQILHKYFRSLPCYSDLLDLFLGVTFKTTVGQSLDTRTSLNKDFPKENGFPLNLMDTDKFENYSFSLYRSISLYKTCYYTCYLPVTLALSLAGISRNVEATLWENVEKITLEIGQLFQAQDDYFDCFGDEREIGKVGSDIQEGKCTWLFVTAKDLLLNPPPETGNSLERQKQYQLLQENYGKFDEDSVTIVKQLYQDLKLPKYMRDYQERSCQAITEMIPSLNLTGLESVLTNFFDRVYKRTF